ncbi:TetR/AcrR family transcriptional regulator [Oricola sp.]|uniref:TetR/AcrR family transcriptional regulator n=1 Tax=Oricola sp. TaxID=1979950 RepID=UPI00320BB560|nr:TetR/AcrR family transcriptional regulator [Oricola sp.]
MSSDTRSRILEAAWKLLEDGAGGEVRMSDIAKKTGISRQAVYLHFPSRADLLIAVTRYIDEANEIDARLAASRRAKTGVERLDAYIEAWGNYIPEIYGVGKALMAMQETDSEARMAWEGRMLAVREGCEAAVAALARDGALSPAIEEEKATDLLWTLLSVRNWEQLTLECGWSQEDYVEEMKRAARKTLLASAKG